jgi:hypothetical protein
MKYIILAVFLLAGSSSFAKDDDTGTSLTPCCGGKSGIKRACCKEGSKANLVDKNNFDTINTKKSLTRSVVGLRQEYKAVKANTGAANPIIGTTPLVAGTATASGTVLSGANNNPPNSTNFIYPAENSDKAKATCNGRSGCGYSCNTPTTNQCKCTCQSEQTW